MTVANMITILRFLLVPVVVFALLKERVDWAFAGFLVAGISDGVDGFVARHFNLAELKSPNYLALWGADSKAIQSRLGRIQQAASKIISAVEQAAEEGQGQHV